MGGWVGWWGGWVGGGGGYSHCAAAAGHARTHAPDGTGRRIK